MDGIINIAFQAPVLQDMAEHGFILLCGVWFIITDGNPVHRHPPFHSRDIIAHCFSNVKVSLRGGRGKAKKSAVSEISDNVGKQ